MKIGADEPITVDGQETTLRALVAAGKAEIHFVGEGLSRVGPGMNPVRCYAHTVQPPIIEYRISEADFRQSRRWPVLMDR